VESKPSPAPFPEGGTAFKWPVLGTGPGSTRTYVVEYKTNLLEAAWTFLENVPGNGSQQTISVPINSAAQSFYRFHMQSE
jgi:hypothetical protein